MAVHRAPRLGIVVPSGNAAAEPETSRLAGPEINVHTSRFPVLPGKSLRERLDTYNEVLPEALGNFGGLRLDAAVIACSGSHYLLTPEGDRKICDELGERVGAPIASTTLAVVAALEAAGVNRIALISPYEPWLTEISRDYWAQAGLTVERVVKVRAGEVFSPYDVRPDELIDQVRGAAVPEDLALVFTGTGMFTFAALEELARDGDRLLITSNLAAAWWARRTLGLPLGADDVHPLLRSLAARTTGR